MKKIVTFLFLAVGLLLHSSAQTLLQEDFSAETLPSGWSNDSLGNPAVYLWQFDNPGNRVILGSAFDTSFVILDSDHYGVFAQQLSSLTTATFSAAGATALSLELDEQYYTQQDSGSLRKIEATGDGGANWYTIEMDSVSSGYPIASHRIFPLDTLAGSTAIQIRFTYAGAWDYWWAIDNVKVTATVDCTVPPEAGQAVSSHAEVCSTTEFLLSLTGDSAGTGLSYQWQHSPDSLTWSDVAGATSKEWIMLQADSAWYRCLVTCSGQPDSSGTVFVNIQPVALCYCLPQTPACSNLNYIMQVSVSGTTMNSISACQENSSGYAYVSFPASGLTTAVVHQQSTYDFSVRSTGTNTISLWIDYDHSGTFDSLEWTRVDLASVQGSPSVVSIQIPDSSVPGLTGMRIRTRAFGNANGPTDACTVFASGETEDYYITIDTLVSGIQEPILSAFRIYPNPSSGFITLDFGTVIREQAVVTVYSSMGAALRSFHAAGQEKITLDFGDLPGGMYLVKLDAGRQVLSRKVLIRNR